MPYLGDHAWEYVRCIDCGQLFHKWLLTSEWQEVRFSRWMSEGAIRDFEKKKKGAHSPRSRFQKGVALVRYWPLRFEKMTRAIRGEEAVRLLDFGCGWGEFPALAGLLGFEAYGVDRAPARQETSRGQGVTVFPDLESAAEGVGPGLHAITLFQVLEHVEEPLALPTAPCASVEVPGAVLVLQVPNFAGITGIKSRSDYYNIHPLEHINCFTPDSLRKFASAVGFHPAPSDGRPRHGGRLEGDEGGGQAVGPKVSIVGHESVLPSDLSHIFAFFGFPLRSNEADCTCYWCSQLR